MRPLIQIRVVQFDGTAMPDVHFSFRPAVGTEYQPLQGSYEPGSGVYTFLIDDYKAGSYSLRIEAPGYAVIEKKAEFRDTGYSGEIFLVDDETECVKMGGRRVYFRRKPRLLGVLVSGYDAFQEEKERVQNSPVLKGYLLYAQQPRLIFAAPAPQTKAEESDTILRELLRAEFRDFLITDQAIETIGGRIEFLSRRIGIELEQGVLWEVVQQKLGVENVRPIYRDPNVPSFYLLEVESAEPYVVLDVVYALLKSPLVKASEPQKEDIQEHCAPVRPGDLLRPWQWYLNRLRLPEAWELLQNVNASLTFGSADVILAIHDTGIETKSSGTIILHPDLIGGVAGGSLTAYLGGKNNKVYYQYDFSPAPLAVMVGDNDTLDPEHHGIAVSGLATAKSDGTTGIVGIAPNVRLASFKRSISAQNAYAADHLQFISGLNPGWSPGGLYAAMQQFPPLFRTGDNSGPGAFLINCSHTKPIPADLGLLKALSKITLLGRERRGVVIFAAAGNSDQDTRDLSKWGNDLNVIKIAASTVNSNGLEMLAAYSSHSTIMDPGLDVCAPADSNWIPIHNPPKFYGVVTHEKVGAGNVAGTNVTQALIQGDPAPGADRLTLPAADFPNYPGGTNVIIRHPADNEIVETNQLIAPPAAPLPLTVYLSTPLDTDFPAGSLIIRGANDYTDKFSGTSAATPMVSGIAALMLSANPALTWAEVRQILRDTAIPIALRYLGPNGSRDKRWVNDADEAVIDVDGLMHIPAGTPVRTITTALNKGATIIDVTDANAFQPRQAVSIGAESKLSAPTTTVGPMANTITVDRGDDFEPGDVIYIGKQHETLIDRAEPDVPGGVLQIRVADPDGFVVGDVLDVGGQQVQLNAVSYLQGGASTDARVLFSVSTIGGVAFAAAPLGISVRIGATQREGPFTITAKAGNLLTLSANVANVHPIGRIIQKENTEIAVVKRVVSPNRIEVYPLINDHPVTNVLANLHITGGRIAFYSHGFGYGRVDAYEAVKAAINYTHNDRDVMIRNFMDDDGVTNRAAQPVHSPDLWVTNDSPTPAGLAYALEGPHQYPRVTVSAPVFVGAGLNDLSAEGIFVGAATTIYIIEITTAGPIDRFTWRAQGSAPSGPMDITAALQDIDIDVNGFLFITFGAVTGHTVGDKWYIRCEKITNRYVHLRLRNRGALSTFAASAFAGNTTPVNQYRIFLCLSDGTPVVQYYPSAGGVDDLSVVSHYSGAAKDIITVKISATGATDSFKWSKGSGIFSPPIAITGGAQLIQDGVSIQFGAVTGHVIDDTWVLKCYPAAQKFVNIDHFILSNPSVPFSLTANRPGTWLMDEQTFPVLAAGEDRYYSFAWPEDNRPPSNGFGVARPARPLRMFIMGEIVPHDGLLMGDVPEQDNNFSYHEIIFARFGFKKRNLVEEIASYVKVDSFGTVANEDFSVQIITDVSSFNAEAVKLEFLIKFDNGTTDTKVFEFNGGAWGFAGGTPNWCTLDASPKQAGGVMNATGEQYYMTFSGTLNVSRQYKNIQITPKIYSTVNPAVVLAEETCSVAVFDQGQLASGRYSGVSPADLAPQSHFFADPAGLMQQTDAIAYGPLISGTPADKENKFRVTSLFKASADVNAYAIVDGIVMLQRVADTATAGSFLPNVVNLVIKPYKQAMLGFTPVKYFIYRNLRLDDFLKGVTAADEKLVRASANASAFIQGLWAVHTAQNGAVPFESLVLGYDPANQLGADKIDRVFYRQDPNKQLPFVTRGINIGKFYANAGNDEFGLEIVLEEGKFQPDYDYVRKYKEVIIDVSAMPTGTDKEKFTVRLERERILNYIDPAAFFGMHMSKDGWLQVDDGTGNKTKLSGVDVYDNVIKKFYTKNTLYLDIRNENGLSLNFYGAYDDGAGNALEVGETAAVLTAQAYASDKWPLIIRTLSSSANANDYSLVFLRLRRDYNLKPILYLQHGQPDGPTTEGRFIAGEDLIATASAQTNVLGFRFPNKDLGSGNRVGVAWMLKMDYTMRQEAMPAALTTAFAFAKEAGSTPFYLDKFFGPVDAEPVWTADSPVIAWVSSQNRKYIDGDSTAALGFEHMADLGVAFSQWTGTTLTAGSVLFYAAAKDIFVNSNKKFVPHNNLTDGVSKRSSFFEEAVLFEGYSVAVNVIVDGGDEVITMSLQETEPDPRPAEAMLLVGLTRDELETHLKPLAGFDPRSPRTLLLDEVPGSPFTDPGGQFYRKFKAGLSGSDDTGKAVEAFPTTDIFVYTSDQKFFFTNAFTQAQPFPTGYTRNYEEAFGEEMRSGDLYEISAIAGADVTVILVRVGEPPVDLTREIVPGDQVTIKSVVYNVLSVSGTAPTSGVITLDHAPPGVVPGTDMLYAPAKPLEDYYIAKDRLGSLSGIDPMETLVELFVTGVNGVADNSNAPDAIKALINNYGAKILERARLICNHDGFSYADDRILYWARIKMMVKMKSHPYLCRVLTERNTLVKLFETKSRGYDAVSFSAAGTRKKVLITGFDPFQIGSNRMRGNASGAAVLALHGQNLSLGSVEIHVQTAIFPVRYADFQQNPAPNEGTGVVEQVVERLINPAHPDYDAANSPHMIVTVSLGGGFEFWVDRFASRRRGGAPDNLSVVNNQFPDTAEGDQFYETKLPETKIVPSNNISGIFKVFYNNFFWYQWYRSLSDLEDSCYPFDYREEPFKPKPRPPQPNSGTKKIEDLTHPQHLFLLGLVPSALTENTLPKKADIIARKGSGGTYLSNESFYRVARLREKYAPSLITGHYHVPVIQHNENGSGVTYSAVDNSTTSTKDLNPVVLKQLIEEIRDALLRAFS
jgi:Subtilase family